MAELEVLNKTSFKFPPAFFKKASEKTLKASRFRGRIAISVALVGVQEARRLNWQYRRKRYAPSVLSFSWPIETKNRSGKKALFGEIVLSPQVVLREAKAKSLKKEIKFFFVHGLLHVLGYDHKTMRQAKRMEKLEENILQ